MQLKTIKTAQPVEKVNVSDKFWTDYTELVRNTVIPYQWGALNDRVADAEPRNAVKNFKIAAGLEEEEYKGYEIQDTDVAKFQEAV